MSDQPSKKRGGWKTIISPDFALPEIDIGSHHLLEAAEGFHMIGMYRATLEELDKVPAHLQEHPIVLHLRTRAHWHLRETSQALEAVERYMKVLPNHPFGYCIKAEILIYQGRLTEARELSKSAVTLFPAHGTLHYDLAVACAKCGHWPEAREFAYVAMCVQPGLKPIILDSEQLAPIRAQIEAMDPHN